MFWYRLFHTASSSGEAFFEGRPAARIGSDVPGSSHASMARCVAQRARCGAVMRVRPLCRKSRQRLPGALYELLARLHPACVEQSWGHPARDGGAKVWLFVRAKRRCARWRRAGYRPFPNGEHRTGGARGVMAARGRRCRPAGAAFSGCWLSPDSVNLFEPMHRASGLCSTQLSARIQRRPGMRCEPLPRLAPVLIVSSKNRLFLRLAAASHPIFLLPDSARDPLAGGSLSRIRRATPRAGGAHRRQNLNPVIPETRARRRGTLSFRGRDGGAALTFSRVWPPLLAAAPQGARTQTRAACALRFASTARLEWRINAFVSTAFEPDDETAVRARASLPAAHLPAPDGAAILTL